MFLRGTGSGKAKILLKRQKSRLDEYYNKFSDLKKLLFSLNYLVWSLVERFKINFFEKPFSEVYLALLYSREKRIRDREEEVYVAKMAEKERQILGK